MTPVTTATIAPAKRLIQTAMVNMRYGVSARYCEHCNSLSPMVGDTVILDLRDSPDPHGDGCPFGLMLKALEVL